MHPTQPPHPAARWMAIAHSYAGLVELTPQGELHPIVRSFFAHTRFPPSQVNRHTSWCAAYACTVLDTSGTPSPRSARARDFLHWGIALARPVYGAILVFQRGLKTPNDPRGHVGFCEHYRAPMDLSCWGGNQRNSVCALPKSIDDLLGVRWPIGVPLPPDAEPLK